VAECRSASHRNSGRHHSGIAVGFDRNTQTPRSRRESNLTEDQLNWLNDRPLFKRSLLVFMVEDDKKAFWESNKDEVLSTWAKESPCTRPSHWWLYDAPKAPIKGGEHMGIFGAPQAQRERLGGVGTPSPEVLGIVPCFHLGIPTSWVDSSQEAYYNGRAKDIHGELIVTQYKEGNFKGLAIDPNDPPKHESQAAFLQRHGLLTTEEKRHLAKHPELLELETVQQ